MLFLTPKCRPAKVLSQCEQYLMVAPDAGAGPSPSLVSFQERPFGAVWKPSAAKAASGTAAAAVAAQGTQRCHQPNLHSRIAGICAAVSGDGATAELLSMMSLGDCCTHLDARSPQHSKRSPQAAPAASSVRRSSCGTATSAVTAGCWFAVRRLAEDATVKGRSVLRRWEAGGAISGTPAAN